MRSCVTCVHSHMRAGVQTGVHTCMHVLMCVRYACVHTCDMNAFQCLDMRTYMFCDCICACLCMYVFVFCVFFIWPACFCLPPRPCMIFQNSSYSCFVDFVRVGNSWIDLFWVIRLGALDKFLFVSCVYGACCPGVTMHVFGCLSVHVSRVFQVEMSYVSFVFLEFVFQWCLDLYDSISAYMIIL